MNILASPANKVDIKSNNIFRLNIISLSPLLGAETFSSINHIMRRARRGYAINEISLSRKSKKIIRLVPRNENRMNLFIELCINLYYHNK